MMCGRTACSLSKRALQKATSYPKQGAKSDAIVEEKKKENSSVEKESGSDQTTVAKDGVMVETQWLTIHPSMDYTPSYNQCPGSCLPILVSSAHHDPNVPDCGGRSIIPMVWGLIPSWFKQGKNEFKFKTINARSDKLVEGETSMYKLCLAKGRRGLLLVEGYFEWTRDKQPHFFYHPQTSDINYKTRENWSELNFVGEDGRWKGPKIMTLPVIFDVNHHVSRDSTYYSFSIITTEAHDQLQWIHDRMPAILDNDEDRNKWLNYQDVGVDEAIKLVSNPYAGKLEYHVVPDQVGNPRYTSINCVLAIDPLKKQSKQPTIDSFFKRANPNKIGASSSDTTPAKVLKFRVENKL